MFRAYFHLYAQDSLLEVIVQCQDLTWLVTCKASTYPMAYLSSPGHRFRYDVCGMKKVLGNLPSSS